MGNVGLSFGSATSGQGFDVTATVNQIVSNLQAVETPWKTQLTKLADEDTQLSSLGTQLSTLTTDLQDLTDFIGVLSSREGSSSDDDVLSLSSASSSAASGTHTVMVQNLAQTSTGASGVLASTDALSGSISIQVGMGPAHTVNVGDSSTGATIDGLAKAINRAGIGVIASVLTDMKGSRLSIVSSTDGSTGTLTLSSALTNTSSTLSDKSVALTRIQSGIDANILVDGVQLTNSSNTVVNAIFGVTFQLLSVPNVQKNVQVVIVNDTKSVVSAVAKFVADYNTVMKAIKAQEGKDASGNPQPLCGTSILARLQESLQTGLSGMFGSGAVNAAYSLGITVDQDGTISLNTDTLTSILNSSYSDVVDFFQKAGGFGATFADTLNHLGSVYSTGAISSALKENASEEKTLNNNVSRQEELIAEQKTRLTVQLNMANQILQSIPEQINQVNEMYSAITGYKQNG